MHRGTRARRRRVPRRRGQGWIGLNASSSASTAAYTTGLPDGVYCDVITGGAETGGCNGTAVTVSGGTATVTIPAGGAVAIDVDATTGTTTPPTSPVSDTFNVQATTAWGTCVHLVGNVPALGSWDPAKAVPLSRGHHQLVRPPRADQPRRRSPLRRRDGRAGCGTGTPG